MFQVRKRDLSRPYFEHDDAERVHVHRLSVRRSLHSASQLQYLRWRPQSSSDIHRHGRGVPVVCGGVGVAAAADRRQGLRVDGETAAARVVAGDVVVGSHRTRHPEIGEFRCPALVKEDVETLDVAVKDRRGGRVQEQQPSGRAEGYAMRSMGRELHVGVQNVVQRTACTVFHDHSDLPFVHTRAHEDGDVGVAELGHADGLLLQLFGERGDVGEGLGPEDFDGHL
mmetsp:Transcript_16048/g.34844  ORF Transcript_16048/g.34844 Transcript_16048/m.34844 type:complete len:226 (+) Transcript_16048:363-1040(+)